MTRNQRLLVAAGLLISVVFLWIAFNDLNPTLVLETLHGVNLIPIVIGAVWFFASLVVIAARWGYLLRSTKAIPLGKLSELVSIGYMGNNVYPFRAGEVLRIVLLQRNHGVAIARATTVVVIERVFDGLVMLTFIIVALAVSARDIVSPEINTMLNVAAPLFVLLLIAFFVMAARPALPRRLAETMTKILPEKLRNLLLNLTDEVIAGLEAFRTPADLFGAILTSYASWLLGATVYWIVSLAFDMNMSFGIAVLLVGVVNLAGLIPASPGQFGVWEVFTRLVLVAVGIPETTATVYAITIHLVIWLPVTVLGFFFLLRQGLGLSAIAKARELEQRAAAETPQHIVT